MTIKDLIIKALIPLGIDVYFIIDFLSSVPAQPQAEGFFLLWFQILFAVIAIPLLYLIKVVEYFDILPVRDVDILHAKLFYWIVYIIIFAVIIVKGIERFLT
jgi:hypothetical protein